VRSPSRAIRTGSRGGWDTPPVSTEGHQWAPLDWRVAIRRASPIAIRPRDIKTRPDQRADGGRHNDPLPCEKRGGDRSPKGPCEHSSQPLAVAATCSPVLVGAPRGGTLLELRSHPADEALKPAPVALLHAPGITCCEDRLHRPELHPRTDGHPNVTLPVSYRNRASRTRGRLPVPLGRHPHGQSRWFPGRYG